MEAYPVTDLDLLTFLHFMKTQHWGFTIDDIAISGLSRTTIMRCMMLLFKADYIKPSNGLSGHWRRALALLYLMNDCSLDTRQHLLHLLYDLPSPRYKMLSNMPFYFEYMSKGSAAPNKTVQAVPVGMAKYTHLGKSWFNMTEQQITSALKQDFMQYVLGNPCSRHKKKPVYSTSGV